MGLLGHASADTDDEPRIALLELFQRTDVAEHPMLGVFPHRAGIEQDEVRLLHVVTDAKANIHQNAAQLFAVIHVLLAAVAVHVSQRRCFIIRSQNLRGLRIMGIGQRFQNLTPCK